MKKSGENSKIDMRALFGGEPSEYEMRRARKLLGNGTTLLSAEICYPHFTGVSGEAMNAFYSDVAERFFGFACGEALGRAQTVYDADTDPRKRFRFRRFHAFRRLQTRLCVRCADIRRCRVHSHARRGGARRMGRRTAVARARRRSSALRHVRERRRDGCLFLCRRTLCKT